MKNCNMKRSRLNDQISNNNDDTSCSSDTIGDCDNNNRSNNIINPVPVIQSQKAMIHISYEEAQSFHSKCIHCEQGFDNENDWKEHHYANHHKSSNFHCTQCSTKSTNWFNFSNHAFTHKYEGFGGGYTCKLGDCKHVMANKFALFKHWYTNQEHRNEFEIDSIPSKSKWAVKLKSKKKITNTNKSNRKTKKNNKRKRKRKMESNIRSNQCHTPAKKKIKIETSETAAIHKCVTGIDLLLTAAKQIESEEHMKKLKKFKNTNNTNSIIRSISRQNDLSSQTQWIPPLMAASCLPWLPCFDDLPDPRLYGLTLLNSSNDILNYKI